MSDDIKTNITFGREVDFARLEQVVKACGMVKDLNAMKDGVYTKLGESGINLSGGQKARVALARCLYSDADIFLLDDPLAALDAYVGRQVFEHAIKRDLSGKTVLLATHQLQYMQQVDHIIVLDQGKVAESGSYEDLMGKNGVFSSLMAQFHTEDDASAASTVQETAELDAPLDKKPENVAEFVKKEKKETVNRLLTIGKHPVVLVWQTVQWHQHQGVVPDIWGSLCLELCCGFPWAVGHYMVG